MPKTGRATIADVAAASGVGVGTVSRVINGSSGVREATRARVLAAIDQLGYRPSHLAAALSRGTPRTVAIVLPHLTRPSSVERLAGALAVLARYEYDTIVCNVNTPSQRDHVLATLVARHRADGVLFGVLLVGFLYTVSWVLAMLAGSAGAVLSDRTSCYLTARIAEQLHAVSGVDHLDRPAFLAEMRRVCRPGGLVAARDGDYGGFFWFPSDPGLDEWQALYRNVARALGGEPDAGRHLLSWARAAGFSSIEASGSAWCYTGPDDRPWWGDSWARRLTESPFGDRAVEHGLATRADLERLARAWRRWADSEDGWFLIPHGEILCTA